MRLPPPSAAGTIDDSSCQCWLSGPFRKGEAVRMAYLLLSAALLSLGAAAPQKNPRDQATDKKPKLALKAQPVIAMSPARIVLTAELVGGANDYEEYYCPTVEWDWGDGTQSESTNDCAPYEEGKSEIKRRFTIEHVFRAGV